MRSECPEPRPDCKYAPHCFADQDHIVPRRLGSTVLARIYIDLPVNKQQLCRRLHDIKTAEGDSPLPENADMIDAIEASGIYISAAKRKVISKYKGALNE